MEVNLGGARSAGPGRRSAGTVAPVTGERRGSANRWLGGAAALVVVAAAATGLWWARSSDDAGTEFRGPPGTPLGEGFSVAEGTRLIADPLPSGDEMRLGGERIADEGWTATTIVDGGAPLQILEAYLDQGAAVGLVDQLPPQCSTDGNVMICGAAARPVDPDEDPRRLLVTFLRGPRGDVVSDHVTVRFSTIHVPWVDTWPGALAPAEVEVPGPPSFRPLARVGESIGTADELRNEVLVQEGSRMAGPSHLNLNDATGGVVALLEVTGDPDEVLDAYRAHLLDLGLGDSWVTDTRTVGDAELTITRANEAGGDHLSMVLVERPGRPTWLTVTGGHD